MKLLFTCNGFVLIFSVIGISDTYVCKECEVGRQVLKYFNPPSNEKEDVGFCADRCNINTTLTDPVEIEAARNAIYQCSKVKVSCKNKSRSKYRTIDGSCNNLKNPSWGKSENCHRILLPHDYSDGVSSLRKSCTGQDLPLARVISNALHRETKIFEGSETIHFMEWGQTVAHDIARTPVKPPQENDVEHCCYPYPKIDDQCLSEEVPPDDPFYIGKQTCLSYWRTIPCSLCKGGRLEALNEFTSYFDLSLLYGNTDYIAQKLRSHMDGMLETQYIPGVGDLPPPIPSDEFCKSLNSTHQCFFAGDYRIAQNPFITVTHIILLRHHNNLCRELKLLNPHWDDEKLYQEARRINIAQAQYITFTKYLPIVLGSRLMFEFKLEVLSGNRRTSYNSQIDATSLDEVVSGAHRYGHSFVPNSVQTEDPESRENGTVNLIDYFFYPFDYYNGLLDRLALGMTKRRTRTHNLFYSTSMRDYAFHERGVKTFAGIDLAATTIARGRDHGLPGYSYYLKELFDHDVRSFCDLRRFISPVIIRRMRKLYKSVHDIDLYTGGLAEYKVSGALLGPTFTALILIQTQKMKFGDRYYFEHGNQAGSFTKEQLFEIKKASLSKIICDTTKILEIQLNVFHPPSKQNPVKSCVLLPTLDLSAWKESPYGERNTRNMSRRAKS